MCPGGWDGGEVRVWGDARVLSVGFLHCRGWWLRELNIKCMLKRKKFRCVESSRNVSTAGRAG